MRHPARNVQRFLPCLDEAVRHLDFEPLPEPEEGSYYWSDLIGLQLVNAGGEVLGEVKEMFSNGAQDVIDVIDVAGGVKRLVPWTAVLRVDIAARRIEVEWQKDW